MSHSTLLRNLGKLSCCPMQDGLAVFSTRFCSNAPGKPQHYKVVIVGGGAGGSTACNHFAPKLGKGAIAVVEPSQHHYYQPGFTLVGGGLKKFEWTRHSTQKHLHKNADWLKVSAKSFEPDENCVTLSDGTKLSYDVLLVAMGVQLRFDLVENLPDALEKRPNVLSNYSPKYVSKTFPAFQNFKGGRALFTHPDTPLKCAGAPQKACYLFESHLSKYNKRTPDTEIHFNTAIPAVFGVPKYAQALMPILKRKGITLNVRHVLRAVKKDKDEALFHVFDEDGKLIDEKWVPFSLLHVGAPCSAPEPLRNMATLGSKLVDPAGFVAVHKNTLKHLEYPDVFAIGDCTALPNAKTAAAVAAQWGVVRQLMAAKLNGKSTDGVTDTYDGYGSCPLITDYGKTILAEFGYDGQILETFPINMGKERYTSWLLKTQMMAPLYWNLMVDSALWRGPKWARKLFHLGMTK